MLKLACALFAWLALVGLRAAQAQVRGKAVVTGKVPLTQEFEVLSVLKGTTIASVTIDSADRCGKTPRAGATVIILQRRDGTHVLWPATSEAFWKKVIEPAVADDTASDAIALEIAKKHWPTWRRVPATATTTASAMTRTPAMETTFSATPMETGNATTLTLVLATTQPATPAWRSRTRQPSNASVVLEFSQAHSWSSSTSERSTSISPTSPRHRVTTTPT